MATRSRGERAADTAGETAVTVGKNIASASRWARLRATQGSVEERSFAAAAAVIVAVVLAIATGALVVAAVHGSGSAAFGVVVLGPLLGMAALASVVLAVHGHRGAGMTATEVAVREPDVDAQSRQLGRDLEHAADVMGLGGRGWPVGREAMARWIGTEPADLDEWMRGRLTIPLPEAERARSFVDMATTLEDTIRPERLPTILATRPVLMLGGRTYFQALNDGAPLQVVADSARLSVGGERVETEEGHRFAARKSQVLWEPGTPTARRRPARAGAKATTRTTQARSGGTQG
jgi:hypothetical protein